MPAGGLKIYLSKSLMRIHSSPYRKVDVVAVRYIVAGEAIKKNQPIYHEKAYAFIPVYNDYHPDTIPYHFQNCAKTNCIPFPCNDCVRRILQSNVC